jgi:SAM-dependent methyltransferase
MMFGFRDVFEYFECSSCGCLQLINPPADLGRYYPPDSYYSFDMAPISASQVEPPSGGGLLGSARRWLALRLREAVLFESRGIYGRLARLSDKEWTAGVADWARYLRYYIAEAPRQSLRTRILDVGCGTGNLISSLARYGFDRPEGVDPFIRETIIKSGYKVRKADVISINDNTYDLVLMNHSLEHIPDQIETLTAIRKLLDRRGVCRIEIPVAGCEAWRSYGSDWVEIDAPRHFFLHTRKSFETLAAAAGLEIYRADDVGIPFAFWGSEMYRRQLPLTDEYTKQRRDPAKVFTDEEINEFERRSAAANRNRDGGRIAFYLRRS